MTTRDITKKVVKAIVGISTTYVVSSVLSGNVHPVKLRHKAELAIGSSVIGAMVADRAGEWSDNKVDELFDAFMIFNKKVNITVK